MDGERGLISFYENKKIKKQLLQEKETLIEKLQLVEKKNKLLTDELDLDYLEILIRKKFMMGRASEKIYINR